MIKDLRNQRDLAGLTQFSLCCRSGVSRLRISLAENGELVLSATEEAAVREALRETLADKKEMILNLLSQEKEHAVAV